MGACGMAEQVEEVKYEERSFPHMDDLIDPQQRRWDRKLRFWCIDDGRDDRFGFEGMRRD